MGEGLLTDTEVKDQIQCIAEALHVYANVEWYIGASQMEEQGAYELVASIAQISDTDLWVDLGVGAGQLPNEVYKRSSPTAIGVDMNPYMLELAKDRFTGGDAYMENDYDFLINRKSGSFQIRSESQTSQTRSGSLNLILADFENPATLVDLLGENCADCVTFCNPGNSDISLAQEKSYGSQVGRIPGKTAEESVSYLRTMLRLEMRKNAFDTAKKILKPGGRFVYADRYTPQTDPEDLITASSDDTDWSLRDAQNMPLNFRRKTGLDYGDGQGDRYTEVKFIVLTYVMDA